MSPRTDDNTETRISGRASRWLLPPAASLAIHAGLVIGLTAVTIEVTRDRPQARPARVTLSAPTLAPAGPKTAQPDQPPLGNDRADISTEAHTPALTEPVSITEASARLADTTPPPSAPIASLPQPIAESLARPSNADAPRVGFAQIDAAPARTAVFVVDASGAVATSFTFVREELLRSIDRLAPTQRFQVIVFPGPDNTAPVVAPINRGRLALASPESKRIVAEWIQGFRPRGRSRPLQGLRMALELKPDIAMLITRSIERTGPDACWGKGLDATLAELDQLNPVNQRHGIRRTSIAAIQLLDDDPTGIMPAIAQAHGSSVSDYQVISAESLITPQEQTSRSVGTQDQSSIDAAASILSGLDESGATLRIFHGLADDDERASAKANSQRAKTLAQRTPDDARARVLAARAASLSLNPRDVESAIADLQRELLYDADADTWRRLAIIDALATLGKLEQANALIADLSADTEEIGISNALAARLITTRIALGIESSDTRSLLRTPPFLDAAGFTDPYWTLAIAEAQTRALLRAGDPNPVRPLVQLLNQAKNEQAEGWAPILTERIVRVADMDPAAIANAPAEVRLLAARGWARSPKTRERAEATLSQLIVQPSDIQADALWELAVLQRSNGSQGSTRSAAQHFATLAKQFPDHPNAPDALAGAIAITSETEQLRSLLTLATQTRVDRPEIELWRLRLAELLSGPARLNVLESVSPQTREAKLAIPLYITAAQQLIEDSTTQEALAQILERTAEFLLKNGHTNAPGWFARAARATLDVDTQRSLDLAERAIALDPGTSADAHLSAAMALIALGREDEAAQRLSTIATQLDATADRSDTFWHAWTLLLETAGQANPASARAHLARLELVDPNLGGTPWSTRLRTLERSLTND